MTYRSCSPCAWIGARRSRDPPASAIGRGGDPGTPTAWRPLVRSGRRLWLGAGARNPHPSFKDRVSHLSERGHPDIRPPAGAGGKTARAGVVIDGSAACRRGADPEGTIHETFIGAALAAIGTAWGGTATGAAQAEDFTPGDRLRHRRQVRQIVQRGRLERRRALQGGDGIPYREFEVPQPGHARAGDPQTWRGAGRGSWSRWASPGRRRRDRRQGIPGQPGSRSSTWPSTCRTCSP